MTLLALSLAALAVLIGLGVWQLQRLHWKEDLIAKLSERAKAAALQWPAARARILAGGDVEYLRVVVTGRFLHEEERHLYATGPNTWGWHVLTPLALDDGGRILVNRGFVPDVAKDRATRAAGLPAGTVSVTGLLRRPSPARPWFVPDNDPARNRWYWLDLPAIAASLPGPAAPWEGAVVLEAEATAGAPMPAGGATRLDIANRHLEYALTWFGLAGALAAVLSAYLLGGRRRQSG